MIDDHFINGGTLKNITEHIESNDGKVIAASTLINGVRDNNFKPTAKQISRAKQFIGKDNFEAFHEKMFGVPAGDTPLFTAGELKVFRLYDTEIREKYKQAGKEVPNDKQIRQELWERLSQDVERAAAQRQAELGSARSGSVDGRGSTEAARGEHEKHQRVSQNNERETQAKATLAGAGSKPNFRKPGQGHGADGGFYDEYGNRVGGVEPQHRTKTIDFSGKGIGTAGLATRTNALADGSMTKDEAVVHGTAIVADAVDIFSDSKLGKNMGWAGNALGIFADSYSGYKQGGLTEGRYQGLKSTLNTTTSLAVFLDRGKNIAYLFGKKGAAMGGLSGFAGRMGLINAFSTAASDGMDYYTGRKELTYDNATGTTLDTAISFDPIKAVTSMAGGATNFVGNIAKFAGAETVGDGIKQAGDSIGNISISSVIDRGYGLIGVTEGKGEQIGDIKNESQAIYKQEQERFKAGELDPSLRAQSTDDPNRPKMSDYKHLAAIKHQMAKYLKDGKIDGHSVGSEFHEIDMTNASNYMAYKNALNKAILEQSKIMEANSSMVPRWMRAGWFNDSIHKYNEAESQKNLYLAAEKEFGMFESRMLAYNRDQQQAQSMLAAQSAAQDLKLNGKLEDTDNISLTNIPTIKKPDTQIHS